MTKILINKCFGGFGLSHRAVMLYAKLKGITLYPCVEIRKRDFTLIIPFRLRLATQKEIEKALFISYLTKPPKEDGSYEEGSYFLVFDIPRTDKVLIKVVETLGPKAWGHYAELKIVNVPDCIKWEIDEYDGQECVAEKHRVWE